MIVDDRHLEKSNTSASVKQFWRAVFEFMGCVAKYGALREKMRQNQFQFFNRVNDHLKNQMKY